MKRFLKNRKGFSLVELLIALLIMAVIAAVAINLFGGVLGSSRVQADRETGENIKRQILTYMNSTNDYDLSCLGGTSITSDQLVERLACTINIPSSGNNVTITPLTGSAITVASGKNHQDLDGTYGPFLDGTKDLLPQDPNNPHWSITVKWGTQSVQVDTVTTSSAISITQ